MPDDDRRESTVLNTARGLLGSVGGDPEEFDAAVDQLVGDAGADAIDAAFMGGVSDALRLGAQTADLREELREADDPVGGPLVHARERELAGGGVAVRVLCEDPDATLYRGPESVRVSTDAGEREVPLGFEPGRADREDSESMSEWVVYPAGYEEPPALPEAGVGADDEEDGEESEDAGEEDEDDE